MKTKKQIISYIDNMSKSFYKDYERTNNKDYLSKSNLLSLICETIKNDKNNTVINIRR